LGDNLKSHLEALEEIGAAASKEFSLEKAMKAMKSDWSELVFSLLPYRDSGTHILSAVDDVQVKKKKKPVVSF
jgi:dynein heavy chain